MYMAGLDCCMGSCGCGGSCGASPGMGDYMSGEGVDPEVISWGGPSRGIGLGQADAENAELSTIADAAQLVPVVGNIASDIVQIFQVADSMIGKGRREADVIVPVQNQLMNYLGLVTNNLVAGNLTVNQLQAYLWIVQQVGVKFIAFVSNTNEFHDGRASAQALNTIMPYINGTCGYRWPPPMAPRQYNCISWGDGTPGGVGTDGMMGAISRYIIKLGGQAVPVPVLTQGNGTAMPGLMAPLQGLPTIPQAGTLPPSQVAAQLTAGGTTITGGVSVSGFDMSQLLPLGAVAFLLFAARKKFSGGRA